MMTRIAILWFCLAAPLLMAGDGGNDHPERDLSAEEISRLVAKLGDNDFEVRERATTRLENADSTILEQLARSYRQCNDFEVRLRVKDVIRSIYFREALPDAFLGVKQQIALDTAPMPAPGQGAVRIVEVIPGTAAAHYKLRKGDLLIAVNNEIVPEGASPELFGQMIRSFRPGDQVMLTIIRDNQIMTKTIRLGYRPPSLVDVGNEKQVQQVQEVSESFAKWWQHNIGEVGQPTDEGSGRPPRQ